MLAYHNDPTIKQEILQQLQGHYDADEIVKGQYWENGKGCAVGCTLHTNQHREYETRFGIPKVLAHLEDVIFERLPNEEAKDWPMRFMSAINVGADLSAVWREFAFWMLVDPADGVIKYTHPGTDVYQAIMRVATLYRDGYTQQQMRDAAEAAAKAASYASNYAAKADYGAALADYAAYAAAEVAANAAYASAAHAAHAAHAASAAVFAAYAAATKHAAYIKMSNKLIELLEKQEVTC